MSRPLPLSSVLAALSLTAAAAACASSPPPAANAPATASATSAAAAPAAPAPPPPPPPPPPTATDVINQGRAPFDACYALARKTNPNLGRTNIEMTFTMGDDGKLANVDFVYRNRMDDTAKTCMRRAAEGLTFPASLHGTQTGTIVFTP